MTAPRTRPLLMRGWQLLVLLPRQLLSLVVRFYRFWLKPWLGNACRFEPSCSAYALEALHKHGAVRGSALAGWRLMRCQPWCAGGCDPVPDTFPKPGAGLFTRLRLDGGQKPARTRTKFRIPRP